MFLPGLTADHRLFEKQIEYFEKRQNVFVWDAPSHALSMESASSGRLKRVRRDGLWTESYAKDDDVL